MREFRVQGNGRRWSESEAPNLLKCRVTRRLVARMAGFSD